MVWERTCVARGQSVNAAGATLSFRPFTARGYLGKEKASDNKCRALQWECPEWYERLNFVSVIILSVLTPVDLEKNNPAGWNNFFSRNPNANLNIYTYIELLLYEAFLTSARFGLSPGTIDRPVQIVWVDRRYPPFSQLHHIRRMQAPWWRKSRLCLRANLLQLLRNASFFIVKDSNEQNGRTVISSSEAPRKTRFAFITQNSICCIRYLKSEFVWKERPYRCPLEVVNCTRLSTARVLSLNGNMGKDVWFFV